MVDLVLLSLAAYLGIGALFAARCSLAPSLVGWRGQAAVALATLALSSIWPVLAFHRARARLRAAGF
jgi:hypothetical protein